MTSAVCKNPSDIVAEDQPRFGFGANWQKFLATVTDERLARAVQSLETVFGREGLRGKTFIDIGSGSGLFSLAAHRLGARVCSFDFDPDSVACTTELRRREGVSATDWRIERASVLDANFVQSLGQFDAVYSWGVLHHTGDMWTALAHATECVRPDGALWIAIYNDQGIVSHLWRMVKELYLRLPRWLRTPYVMVVGGLYFGQRLLLRVLAKVGAILLRLATCKNPFTLGSSGTRGLSVSQKRRGMHLWYDLVDWVGGYPFEVAQPEEVFRFCRDRGFQLVDMTTCGGRLGCNEFVFRRMAMSATASAESL